MRAEVLVCDHRSTVANRHFGRFADVWKHLLLSAVLDYEHPRGYAETHAGSAVYPLVEDAERQFCDLDPTRVLTLRDWAPRLGVEDAAVVQADGMRTVARWLDELLGLPAVVHVDPFDPDAQNDAGISALALVAEVIRRGQRLVYWYGYDKPALPQCKAAYGETGGVKFTVLGSR